MQVRLEEAPEEVLPKCPFCKSRLEKVWIKAKGRGIIGQEQIVLCPECESFLGFGSKVR
jgi:uncharacterized protein with PIN domain